MMRNTVHRMLSARIAMGPEAWVAVALLAALITLLNAI